MTHVEKWLYLYHAVLEIIKVKVVVDVPFIIEKKYVKICKDEIQKGILPEFPDYIFDVHTLNSKKTVVDFANEGALVKDECTIFKNEIYREFYCTFKEV